MLLGHWKNFDDLEENLTLEELMSLLEAKRNQEYEEHRFHAAIQGQKLPAPANSKFEQIKERVRKRIADERSGQVDKEREDFKALRIAFEED